jgi:hypothetical protein
MNLEPFFQVWRQGYFRGPASLRQAIEAEVFWVAGTNAKSAARS